MSYVDAIRRPNFQPQARVSERFIAELETELHDIYTLRDLNPSFKQAFSDAAEIAFGAKFHDNGVELTYYSELVPPSVSRVEAQLFLFEQTIRQWAEQRVQEARSTNHLELIPEADQLLRTTHDFCEYLQQKACAPATAGLER